MGAAVSNFCYNRSNSSDKKLLLLRAKLFWGKCIIHYPHLAVYKAASRAPTPKYFYNNLPHWFTINYFYGWSLLQQPNSVNGIFGRGGAHFYGRTEYARTFNFRTDSYLFLQMRYLKVAARLYLVNNAILLVGNKNTMGVILEAGNCIG